MDRHAGEFNRQRSVSEICWSPCRPPLPAPQSGNASQGAAQTDAIVSANGKHFSIADPGMSLSRARTMKDFENQITDLKKENFNLKLRIYFLEEQVKEKCDGANENIYKTNIELKVEVESLKHHLQEKHNLLKKALNEVESLSGESGSAVLRVRADAEKQVKTVEEAMSRKNIQLEEDLKVAQKNVETVSLLLEEEKRLRLRLEQVSLEHEKMDTTNLIEKNKIKAHLSLVLNSKDQAGLSDQTFVDDKIKEFTDCLWRKDREIEALQHELNIKAEELDKEKKNSFKRDKTIQGLTIALRSKDKKQNANTAFEEHPAKSEFMNSKNKTDGDTEMGLDEICLLRKQLEETIQAYHELCKNLEEKNKIGKNSDDDTFSLLWDQTTYLSICLGEKDPSNLEIENLSLVELRKKVRQLLLVVQELQSQISAQNSKQCKHCTAAFEAEESDHFSKYMDIPSTYMKETSQQFLLNEDNKPPSVEFTEKPLEREEIAEPEIEVTSAIINTDQSGNIVLKSCLEQSTMQDHSEFKDCSDLSKTQFYEDVKNVSVNLGDERDHFSIENKGLKQDMGVQNSRSISPHFTPAPSTFSVGDNYVFHAIEENEHVKDECISEKKQQLIDEVLIAGKALNPTNETQGRLKKSRLPIPLKSYMNSRSQNITKILMDQPDVNKEQEMQLEEKNEEHNVTGIVSESLSIKERVHLNGCGIHNPADETLLYLRSEGSELGFQNNVDTSSNKHEPMVDYNVQHSPPILQDRSHNSYSKMLTSPEQQEFKYAPESIIQCKPVLQKEKEGSMCLNQVTDLQRQMGALSPSRFAFLADSQACELSFEQQQVLDACNLCIVYHEHLINLAKAFEELLHASDVDYYVAEGFREQLNQSMHLLQRFEGKLCYDIFIEKLQEMQTLRNRSENTMNNNRWQMYDTDPEQEKENEDVLREYISKKSYVCDHLHNEYERVHTENEKLCKILDERDEEIKRLAQELSNTGNEFNRLQCKLKEKECLLSDDSQVLQSLKAELEMYKKIHEANKTETDLLDNEHGSSQHSSCSLVVSSATVRGVVPGFQMCADKNGCHVLGLNEDHSLLRKHIAKVWKLLSKTKCILEDFGSKEQGPSSSKVPDQGCLKSVGTNVGIAQKTLEEAACLSKLFWRVTLPIIATGDFTNLDEMKMEISQLQSTLSHQQKRLHSTMKQLQSANLIKENMEKIIVNQLALTHNVLKKARGNLESTK